MKTTAQSPWNRKSQCLFVLLALLCLNAQVANAQRTMAVDRFGNSYTEQQVYINTTSNMLLGGGGPVVCTTPNGLFVLHFNESGSGFNDMMLGAQRRDVACQVFADLEQLILPAANPYPSPYPYPGVGPTPTVHIDVQDFGSIAGLPANAIAAASSYYSYLPVPYPSYISCPDLTPAAVQEGVLDGEVWKTINGGVDSWRALPAAFLPGGSGPGIYHGFFGVKFSAGAPTWYMGSTLPAPALEVDLYKVIAHEAMHLLGFNSLTTQSGTGFMGTNYYSRMDLLLQQGGSSWITDPILCSGWASNTNSGFNSTSGACDAILSGTYSSINPLSAYTPGTWDGSNLSHVDATCPGAGSYLMNPAIYPTQPRIPIQDEVNVLCDIDYHTNTHHGISGSGWDGTFESRTQCGQRLAGVDDLFSDYVTFAFYTYKQGQAAPITVSNFLSNDEDETQAGGTPIDHDCLEIIIGGGSITNELATSFEYTPPVGYVGWAVLRYRPISVADGRRGNWTHIFIEVWPPDICGVETCNIVNGGGFEGIDPNSYSAAPHNSFNSGGSMTPDVKMWNNTTSQWENQQSCITGENECGIGVPVAPSWNWTGPPGNERYVGLFGASLTDYSVEAVEFELCRPLLGGCTYTIEFQARSGGTCPGNVDFFGLNARACNPFQGTFDFFGPNTCNGSTFTPVQFATALPNFSGGWNLQTQTFVYPTGSPDANWLMARTGVATPFTSVSIDDVKIHPIITVDADIEPSCDNAPTGSITLDVHYYPGISILWSNGATTATIDNLAPGIYTVTITDTDLGCPPFTDSYTVGSVPCGPPFTITKTVNDEFTYSGAPILYTITVCNNTTLTQNVVLTDAGLSNFVVTGMTLNGAPFAWPGFPSAPVTLPNVPAGGCATIEIAGYFTAIGTYTNCATADPVNEDPVSDCAEPVVVQQNCPLMVSGWGDCVNGPVHLCLSVHSLIVDVKTIDFLWVFPSFLQPPTIAGAIIPAAAGGLNGASTISAEQPWTPMPGWSYVAVHLVYNNPISTMGVNSLLCVDLGYDGAVTPGVNVYQTFATNAAPYTINNHVTLLDGGGLPIQPGGFWTNPANIILLGCPGVPMIDASFTLDVPACGGAVSVHGNLTDPNAIHMWTWGDDRTTPTNGAQDYTYDYFAAIPLNQTPAYSVPPAPPGTYTITHTVILNGVASSSQQTITIYVCCQAATVIHDGDLASVAGTYFTGTVDIQGQFIVDTDVTFDNATVTMESGAEILIQDGINLWVNTSTIESCQDVMWKSITTGDGCIVQLRGSMIADAESAVLAQNSSIILVDNSEFKNNRVALGVPDQGSFNSVAIHSANSTYHAEGPLKQPYPGQTSALGLIGFAALDVYDMSLDFTGGGNNVYGLSNGIVAHRSDVSVNGCAMWNIQPDAAYTYAGNGAGIYARGDHGFFTLKQQGFGMTGAASFDRCRWGVYTEYMNVRSTDNNMTNMGTAYRVDRSGYMFVDILNNKVRTKYNGMDFRTNDGAAHLLAQDNDITFGDYPTCVGCKPYHAIYVSEGNMANTDSRIQNNTIHFLPLSTSGIGIGLYAADDWLVAGNDLQMTSNAFNRTGIWTNGCNRPEVSCNTVNSTGTTYPIDAQAAIRNNMGKEPLISCNSVDHTANGILFNGVAYNTDIRGNFFHNHRWPLHLDATAIIDAQVLKGNLWDPAAAAPVWGAWYEVTPLQAAAYRFWYNPITVGAQPPSWSPANWFAFDPGVNYDCANHHGLDYCSQFHDERCKDCLRELDEKIAGDSLENDPYTDETKWMLKGDLYKKLDDAPALLDSLPMLADFYADLQGSTTAAFKTISDGQLVFYNLDSTVVAQLQENRTQIEGMLGLVKVGLGQLGDSTLTPAQRQAVLTSISGYRENIRDLSAWNAVALQVASASKVLTADGVKAANASVTTSELIETHEKAVNEIYLSTVGKDVDAFTSAQASELFDIANQCPMVGGNAVFKARSLYWLIDETYDFDDALLCLPHGIIVKSLMEKQANAVSVIPNPAGDEATLVLSRTLDEPGVFVVFDALGSEVMRRTVPIEMPRMTITTSSLAPALYHYQVRGPSGIIGDGKITIVR